MTTENELRQALAAEAETMKWSLSMHDVVTAEVVDNVVSLAAARRRRTPLLISAAAAVVGLIGGGTYLAAHRSNNEGRVLAGGPAAGKVAASNAADSSIRFGPSGPVSLAGMTLVLPKDLPKTYRLQNVSVTPVGLNTGSPPGMSVRLMILKGATAAEQMTVTATRFENDVTVGTRAPDTGEIVKVHGVDAQLFNGGSGRDLNWFEGGVQFSVAAGPAVRNADVLKLAESIVPGDGPSVGFSAPTPSGYYIAYSGDGNLQPPWSYNLQYSRENLDKPSDDNIGIDVQPSDGGAFDTLRLLGNGFGESKMVKVGGVDGTLVIVDEGSPASNGALPTVVAMSLVWKTADGLIINLNSQGLSEAEVVAFAESIATVDEASFRAAVGDRLQSNGGYVGPDFTVPGVITFTGITEGRAWTMKATPPGPADSPNANCTQFGFGGAEGSGATCGSLPADDSLTDRSTESDGTFAYGVVSDKVRKVVVRDADTNAEVVAVATVAGTGGDDRRAYVFALKPLGKDVKNFAFVALDSNGEVVGTPTSKPAGEYPGNFADPSFPVTPATSAPPATIYDPSSAPFPEVSDPSKLPVFATGTFEGRPWELRKLAGVTISGSTCWFFSFAAGGLQLFCGDHRDPEMNLVLVRERRTFVLATTAADVTKVKATFKDGRVAEVVPTVKGADRVAAIAVGLNDVLVSVIAVDANGKEAKSVKGTLPGDPSLPFSFGEESGIGGEYSAIAATTAPATTTIKP
jgi:hypothetical protein